MGGGGGRFGPDIKFEGKVHQSPMESVFSNKLLQKVNFTYL